MKKILAMLLALTAAISLVACSGGNNKDPDENIWKVAIHRTATDAWQSQMAQTSKEMIEAAFDDVEVTLLDNKQDQSVINSLLEQCIMEGDWKLVVFGSMADNTDLTAQLQEQGTALAYTAIEWPFYDGKVSQIRCSDYECAYMAAQAVLDQIPENGKVYIVNGLEILSNSVDRQTAFHDVLETRPDITILGEQWCEYDKTKAMNQVEDWITANGTDFDAVFAANDGMALGAVEAMNAAGIDAKAKIVTGVDGMYDGCKGIADGYLDATSLQSGEAYAEAMIDIITKLKSGEYSATTVENYVSNPILIDSGNVQEYLDLYISLGYDK